MLLCVAARTPPDVCCSANYRARNRSSKEWRERYILRSVNGEGTQGAAPARSVRELGGVAGSLESPMAQLQLVWDGIEGPSRSPMEAIIRDTLGPHCGWRLICFFLFAVHETRLAFIGP